MSMREFIAKIDDYNARVHAVSAQEAKLRALQEEREILRNQASDFMRLSQFDAEVATFTLPRFSFPENYQPPAPTPEQPASVTIVRHPEQAAE
jgi:hypothetical protein